MATITKQENGGYRIRVSCGYNAKGRQIMRSKNWAPDPSMSTKQIERELQRVAVRFEDQCKGRSQSGNIKFETFAKQWFEDYAKKRQRPRTLDREHDFEERTYKAIGHLRMDKITTRHVQAFIDNLGETGVNMKTGGGLSPKTIRHYHSFISKVFDYAMNCGIVVVNPCRAVILPEQEQKEIRVYTLEEAQKLVDALRQDASLMYQVYFNLALYGGFRRGEVHGLRWRDIDFKNCMVHIEQTLLYTPARGTFADKTKTRDSKRPLKLPADLFDLLHELRKEQLERGTAKSGLLFVDDLGDPLGPNTPYYWLQKFCAKHDLPFYGIHAFRHTNASLLIGTGADVKTVSAMLGHSQATTTLNIYAHAFAERQAQASDAIADLIMNKKKEQVF